MRVPRPVLVLQALKEMGMQVAIDDFGTGYSSLISRGKSLGLRVIAEGVETREQLGFLQAEGCAAGQGFYFSRALVAGQFAKLPETGLPGLSASAN